jgi:hypothetical protein
MLNVSVLAVSGLPVTLELEIPVEGWKYVEDGVGIDELENDSVLDEREDDSELVALETPVESV